MHRRCGRVHADRRIVMAAAVLLIALSLEVVTYHAETLSTSAAGGEIRDRFSEPQLLVLQKLNRVDLAHLERLRTLIVPDVWVDDELAYSPMPWLFQPGLGHSQVVVVYQPAQVFGAYEYGVLVRWGPV